MQEVSSGRDAAVVRISEMYFGHRGSFWDIKQFNTRANGDV
ncbi:hypothetical protein ACF3DV_10830 [Chlorogloeopsis fritschii PCC 9212]|nr:hypothetical protein [Chlorogloeopsis fritschii]